MNLIIVDDDTLVCTSLKMILETDPAIHVTAMGNSGQEAVSFYDAHQADILLMELMPQNRSLLNTLMRKFYFLQPSLMMNTL